MLYQVRRLAARLIFIAFLFLWFVIGARDALSAFTTSLTEIGADTGVAVLIDVQPSQQPYTRTLELQCGSVKIRILTVCVDDSYLPFPQCVRQELTFTLASTGQVVTKPTTAKRVPVTDAQHRIIGQYLDSLVSAWACDKNTSQSFLILRYSTGGNCDTCEWIEIYDLEGNMRATSKGGEGDDLYSQLKRTYKQLQLPKPWPRSSYIEVPLRREKN